MTTKIRHEFLPKSQQRNRPEFIHADKFRLVQLLLEQLAREEGITLSAPISDEVPQPVGRVYYSGRKDVSATARSQLFEFR